MQVSSDAKPFVQAVLTDAEKFAELGRCHDGRQLEAISAMNGCALSRHVAPLKRVIGAVLDRSGMWDPVRPHIPGSSSDHPNNAPGGGFPVSVRGSVFTSRWTARGDPIRVALRQILGDDAAACPCGGSLELDGELLASLLSGAMGHLGAS